MVCSAQHVTQGVLRETLRYMREYMAGIQFARKPNNEVCVSKIHEPRKGVYRDQNLIFFRSAKHRQANEKGLEKKNKKRPQRIPKGAQLFLRQKRT